MIMSEIDLTNLFIFGFASTEPKVIVTDGLNALASFQTVDQLGESANMVCPTYKPQVGSVGFEQTQMCLSRSRQ